MEYHSWSGEAHYLAYLFALNRVLVTMYVAIGTSYLCISKRTICKLVMSEVAEFFAIFTQGFPVVFCFAEYPNHAFNYLFFIFDAGHLRHVKK